MIFHWNAAEWVVLALRVADPIVGHLDPGQTRMAVEDDAEEVVGLPLVPVAGGVDAEQRRDVRVGVGAGHLELDPAVVGDRQQRVEGVQFAAGVVGVVHTRYAATQFEPQSLVVAQRGGQPDQVFAAHVQGQLVAVDDDAFDRGGEEPGAEDRHQPVDDVVEVAAEGAGGALHRCRRAGQASVAGGVTAAADAEHARLDSPVAALLPSALWAGHRSNPFNSRVVGEASAAFSAAAIASARCTPSGVSAILACRARMACSSISGRGGQPGR